MKRIYIKDVICGSAAEEMEISAGDYLLSVNGVEINDILDYKFQIFDEFVTLEIEKPDGEIWDVEIEKEENEDIGLVFEEQLIDKPRSCANKCIFCFMDQLPPDVRETLVFKDDDFRLSFMTGNYVTFTNSGYKDLDRIINYRLPAANDGTVTPAINQRHWDCPIRKPANNRPFSSVRQFRIGLPTQRGWMRNHPPVTPLPAGANPLNDHLSYSNEGPLSNRAAGLTELVTL